MSAASERSATASLAFSCPSFSSNSSGASRAAATHGCLLPAEGVDVTLDPRVLRDGAGECLQPVDPAAELRVLVLDRGRAHLEPPESLLLTVRRLAPTAASALPRAAAVLPAQFAAEISASPSSAATDGLPARARKRASRGPCGRCACDHSRTSRYSRSAVSASPAATAAPASRTRACAATHGALAASAAASACPGAPQPAGGRRSRVRSSRAR